MRIIDPFLFTPTDPYYSSTIEIANFIGSNGDTTFVNNAPAGTAPISSGGCALSNAQSPFGGTSLRCQNSIPTYASIAGPNSVYALGTGDFTLEGWYRWDTASTIHTLMDMRPVSTTGNYPLYLVNASNLLIYSVNGTTRITSGGTWAHATWTYIAVSRVSGTTRMYAAVLGDANTVQVGSDWTDSTNYVNSSPSAYIGGNAFGSNRLTGYVGPVRMTKGVGRYSSTFAVPTAIFPAQ